MTEIQTLTAEEIVEYFIDTQKKIYQAKDGKQDNEMVSIQYENGDYKQFLVKDVVDGYIKGLMEDGMSQEKH